MHSGPQKTSKRARLASRLARGSQPRRRREKGRRFGKDNQPRGRRGRPRGAPNLMTEAIITAFSELGEDLRGKDGLVGFVKRIGRNDLKTAAMLLRAVLPLTVTTQQKHEIHYKSVEEARAELERAGIVLGRVLELEHVKERVIDVQATEVTQVDNEFAASSNADAPSKAEKGD